MKITRPGFFLWLLPALLAFQGCGGSGGLRGADAARVSTSANPAGGSHEQRTYRNPNISLADYSAVLIEPAVMNTTAEHNEKVDQFLSSLQGTIDASLLQALQASGKFQEVTARQEEVQGKRYLVCKSDAMVHFGSTAARLLVGFGAGRSKLIVVHSLVDPQSGEVALKYTGWGGAIAGFGFQILGKMQGDATLIAQYFGNLARMGPN